MSQLLSYRLSVTVLAVLIGQSAARKGQQPSAEQTDPVPPGAVARLGTSRFLNFGRVFSLAFSPDGKTLAAGSWDGVVRLWDVAGRRELRQFDRQPGPVRSLAFSPDGKMLAAGGKAPEIMLWDPATGKGLRRLAGHRAPITFVTFSPDGKLLASKSYDGTLRLWDAGAGREVRQLRSHDAAKESNEPDFPVGISADGKLAASATLAGAFPGKLQRTFRLWDVTTGVEVRSFPDNRSGFGTAGFSPDARLLAIGAGWIRLWDMDSDKTLPAIEAAQSPSSLAFSPDGKTLASGGGGSIQLWEIATRREACHFQTRETGLICLAFSPDGRLLASGGMDVTVLLWDATQCSQREKRREARLSPQELQGLWGDLISPDAAKGRQAVWAMVAADGQSVEFLREHLHPAARPGSAETIARLVGDLDSPQFHSRTRATGQLQQLGELVEPALLEALKKQPSLEMRQRIEQLLNRVADLRSSPSGERLRIFRAVQVLEQIGTPAAQQLLETLSDGAPKAMLTQEAAASLLRLQRMKSEKAASLHRAS
jgi:sugar lactone lactonase YvrE